MFPSTTIGSYPQTDEIRTARKQLREGEIQLATYEELMHGEIDRVIDFQEEIGLDVLVHGEPERNDMVQYFAEQMVGYVFTENAWVQSYGSRYVRPPIIFGDVSRPAPMTVEWIKYAQSQTERPVKGMLTGPVTMLQWSFVRDDQPLGRDLQAAGPGDPRRGRATWRRPASRSSRSTSPRSARGCHCAAIAGTSTWSGPSTPSGSPPPAFATRPRSRPTCVTRTSATSWSTSRRWTPTST